MEAVASALDQLTDDARARVLAWAESRYAENRSVRPAALPHRVGSGGALETFSTLGELMAACSPETNVERVLVASMFVATRKGGEPFTAAEVNAELKNVGHPQSVPSSARATRPITRLAASSS